MFRIEYSNQSVKFLKNLEKQDAKRILSKIGILMQDPIPHDAKYIQGASKLFRVRVGDFRVLYEVDYKSMMLGIIKIDKRDRVYD